MEKSLPHLTSKPIEMKNYLTIFVFLCLAAMSAYGQIPQQISYQGVLAEANGSSASDGNYSMTFSLYNTGTGGAALWQEAKVVVVEDGVFNVILGDVTPLSLDFDQAYWLGIQVGADTELAPRVKLTASAYSLNAEKVGGYEVSSTPAPNTLLPLDNNGQIPASVLTALPTVNMGGVSTGPDASITTTSFTEVTSFTVNESGTYDVYLSGALIGEINGDGSGRYDFRITRDSPNGPTVARGWWRPGAASGFQTHSASLNGVDTGQSGSTTYYLAARKFDNGAKNLNVFIYNLNALWVTN